MGNFLNNNNFGQGTWNQRILSAKAVTSSFTKISIDAISRTIPNVWPVKRPMASATTIAPSTSLIQSQTPDSAPLPLSTNQSKPAGMKTILTFFLGVAIGASIVWAFSRRYEILNNKVWITKVDHFTGDSWKKHVAEDYWEPIHTKSTDTPAVNIEAEPEAQPKSFTWEEANQPPYTLQAWDFSKPTNEFDYLIPTYMVHTNRSGSLTLYKNERRPDIFDKITAEKQSNP